MIILPLNKLANIPTGNPYKGRDGLVDLGSEQSTLDVAELFPFHQVDNGSIRNIRSHLLEGQIRVSYHENNMINEIEVLSPDPRTPEMKIKELFLGDINVFGKTLTELKMVLEGLNYKIQETDQGFDLEDSSISFYSHDYEGDLSVSLDAVTIHF